MPKIEKSRLKLTISIAMKNQFYLNKIKKLFLLTIISSLMVGCYSIKPDMLRVNFENDQNKIHNLRIKGTETSESYNKTLRGQDYYFTYVERELTTNIFENEDNTFGEIDVSTTYNKMTNIWSYFPITLISTATLGIPQLLYIPYCFNKIHYEVDINIYGNNGKLVKKYSYYVKHKYTKGYYRPDLKVAYLNVIKKIMRQFKDDINKDYQKINDLLESNQEPIGSIH